MKSTLIEALKTGGGVLLEYFDRQIPAVQKESQSSVVTEADLKSDSVIIDFLEKKYPGHNILSEESGFRDRNSSFTWVIDPLDGTSNFAAGIPWFGVLITLFEDNVPVIGGAYLPVYNTLYVAEKNKGATKDGKILKQNGLKSLKESLVAFSVDYSEDEAFLNKGLSLYRYIIKSSRNIRSTNCLMDFLYTAEGRFGGCINLFTKVWDISALGLIIAESGGIMTDIYGKEIVYNIGNDILEENFPVVAGSEKVLNSLREGLIF